MRRIQNSQETKQIYLSIKTEYSPEPKPKAPDPVKNPKNESETCNSIKKTPIFQPPPPNLKKQAPVYISAHPNRYPSTKPRATDTSCSVIFPLSQKTGQQKTNPPHQAQPTHSKANIILQKIPLPPQNPTPQKPLPQAPNPPQPPPKDLHQHHNNIPKTQTFHRPKTPPNPPQKLIFRPRNRPKFFPKNPEIAQKQSKPLAVKRLLENCKKAQ